MNRFDDFEDEKRKSDIVDNQISMEEYLRGVDMTAGVNSCVDSIVQSENTAEKMHEVQESIVGQKKKKKKILSFAFLIFNILVFVGIFVGMLESGNFDQLGELQVNIWWFIACFVAFGIIMWTEQNRFLLLIKRATNRRRPFLSFKTCAIGRYYDAITPLSTGGQPFQVWYLNSRGIKTSSAVSVPLAKFIFQQIIFTVFCIVVLIGSVSYADISFLGGTGSTIVNIACWVGFALSSSIVAGTILISISGLGHKTVIGILKLLTKLRIVKDYDTQYHKLIKIVEDYQRTIKFYIKSPVLLVKMLILSLISLLVQYSVPFFLYCAFVGFDINMFIPIVTVAVMVDLASSFIPLPGGSGAAELSFAAMFTALFGGATFWALLVWRFVTYYLFIIQGFGVIIYDYIVGNAKNIRMQKHWKKNNYDVSGNDVEM